MTEGLQGVLIGGAIGIIGSIVVETLRARHHRLQTNREHLSCILEKRKAALLAILEHFREFHGDIFEWQSNPGRKPDFARDWRNMTGFVPHLAILPEPFPCFIRDRVMELYKRLSDCINICLSTDSVVSLKTLHDQISGCIIEITQRVTDEIALIDAEILGTKKMEKPKSTGKISEKIDG